MSETGVVIARMDGKRETLRDATFQWRGEEGNQTYCLTVDVTDSKKRDVQISIISYLDDWGEIAKAILDEIKRIKGGEKWSER